MSANKISLQELTEELAATSNITKRAAEDFIKALFSTVEEALTNNDTVKIKDFGTFKVQPVEARKSVNVQTGEEIVIPGYNKVNFAPDAGLKDLVNEVFAHLEPVALDSLEDSDSGTLRNFTEQAAEIKNIISDIEALSSENGEEETPSVINAVPTPEKNEEIPSANYSEEPVFPKRKKKRIWFAAILLVVLAAAGSYIFVQRSGLIEKIAFRKTATPVAEEFTEIQEGIEPEETAEPIDELQALFDAPRVYTEYIATLKLTEGNRLARLATRYYGNAKFWVYIYEANMDNIKEPDNIPTGTLIRIPKVNP
ncbi:MAG: HU family DNA-binding protein, partial [Prevotellaceae bacterium]|nr:HU family DNA-binding protein [Prevotellaceae bacterium]